jgi:hypothetical protein
MFDTTFTFVKEKVDAADKELDIFIKIMEHMDLLDWDTHAWKNKLCNLAEDLQFLIESNQLNHFQDDASEEIETGLTSLSGDQSNHSQAKFIGTSKSVGASISMGERSNHFATPNMQGSNESVRVRDADTSAFDVHVEHTGCPSYALNEKQAHPVLFKRRDIEFGDVVQT